MAHLGDFDLAATLHDKFTTFRPSSGGAYALASGAVSVFKDGSTTASTAGVTLTVNFAGSTGLNHVAIDTSVDSTFYSSGSFFHSVLTAGTVDSVSVLGSVVSSFTLRKDSALKPTTAARTLDVSAGGEAGLDWANIGSPTTAQVLSGTSISTSQTIASMSGNVGGNVVGSVASVTGNVGGNVVGSVASVTARVTANTDQLAGQTVTAAAGVTFPSTVASPTNITAGTITTVSGNVTGNVGGNVTGSVGSVATGGITSGSFGAGAVDAAALATDAVNEIADGILDRNMATGTDSGTDSTAVRTPRQALRALRNKASIATGTLTVTKENDTTASWTAAITTTAGNPISASDPS